MIPTQIIDIPLASGLDTKTDAKAMQPPGLSVCRDVQFDDIGGIQTRDQYQAITSHASNTIADIRKIVPYGDELVAFSKDKLWSYASGDGLWTERAEYLAVKVDEHARFVTSGEQYDCDRAELGGVTMYCWSETTPSGTESYVAAIDTATGAVKMSPQQLVSPSIRCRLAVTTNRIVLTFIEGSLLKARAYDPADLSYASSGSIPFMASSMFDVMPDPAAPTTLVGVVTEVSQYQIFFITEAGAISSSLTRAVTADGACAIAMTAGSYIAVCYSAGASILMDIRTNALATVALDVAVGTASSSTVNQISAVHDGTQYRAFWSAGEVSSTVAFSSETNTVSDAGTPGTETTLVHRCGLASRSFVHDSNSYVWVAFAAVSVGALVAQLQNSYFLLRADGMIVAKAIPSTGGGFSASEGFLPNVQGLGSGAWAWCGISRRIIPTGTGQKAYSAKALQDVTFEFDSDEARRTAQLGETLYIAGGNVSQYDGRAVVEVGFHTFPWDVGALPGGAGALTGTFNWQQSYSWPNAKGEVERSTTVSIYDAAPSAQLVALTGTPLALTAKTGGNGDVVVEFWRQIAEAASGAPFFLATSKDPAATGSNGYVLNDPASTSLPTIDDDMDDATLITKETWPENGGLVLESLSPPSASIIAATQDRILLAGIPANPYRVAYSKLRGQGEIASFHDSLYVDLPPAGGPITALAFLNETLVVFKESSVYVMTGDGYDNTGGGQNYGPARIIEANSGAISAEAVALTPRGLLFKSLKGWCLLDHGWQVQYIGGAVAEFDGDTVTSAVTVEDQHQVRITTDAGTLIWDHLVGEWVEWTIVGVSGCLWNGEHHIVASDAANILTQNSAHDGTTTTDGPQLDIETGWIKFAGLQGYKLVQRILLLGEYLGAHELRIRVAYNYAETAGAPTWTDDKTWTVSPATAGPIQFNYGVSRPKCQSIKVRITAYPPSRAGTEAPITQALNLTGLAFKVGIKQGGYQGLPAAQRT